MRHLNRTQAKRGSPKRGKGLTAKGAKGAKDAKAHRTFRDEAAVNLRGSADEARSMPIRLTQTPTSAREWPVVSGFKIGSDAPADPQAGNVFV